jgi:hypothetical protein
MAKFQITETIHSEKVKTARLGTTGAGNQYDDKEIGKAVKLSGDSAYVLCVAGDPIEAVVSSLNDGLYDGFSLGGVVSTGYKAVTFDGLQATPGTGTIAVGDFVVTGTVVAKGTALSGALKVTKATMQPGITEAAVVGDVNDMLKVAMFAWRVVSLGSAGTGAVGTTGTIERVAV